MHAIKTETASIIFLPLVHIKDQNYVPAEFTSLYLNSWDVQHGTSPTILSYILDVIHGSSSPCYLQKAMFAGADEPRIVYLPLDDATAKDAVEPLGMRALKEKRLQYALLFKKEYPDESVSVEVTPSLVGDYLTVKSAEPAARVKIRAGDYLMTENGEFIGIMVSKDRCYVLPSDVPPDNNRKNVPLVVQGDQNNYDQNNYLDFLRAAQDLQSAVERIAIN